MSEINRPGRSSGDFRGANPMSPLADTLAAGQSQAGRAGTNVEAGPAPMATHQTVLGFDYLLDLRPQLAGARAIHLSVDDIYAHTCTLVASYNAVQNPDNLFILDAGDASSVSTPLRDFRWLVEYGVAGTKHAVEIDVSEGTVVTLPGATINASLYSIHYSRKLGPQNTQLKSMAHLSTGGTPRAGYVTDRVYCPFQVATDALDLPTIEEQMKRLKAAVCNGEIVAVAP